MTNAVTLASLANSGYLRNRIINGAMMIDQRNAGAAITPTATVYTVDRWQYGCTQSSKGTVQQNAGSVTPPVGFTNYLGFTSSSAYSVLTGDTFSFFQQIEGLNCYDLAWGSANAKTVTLSFWVRSSLTGTFGGAIVNNAQDQSYPFSYIISSSNTWEYKTITIPGPTAGTWLTTTGTGISVRLSFGTGSSISGTAGAWVGANNWSATGATSVVGTNGATFYVTGVQFEVGTQATPFEWRQFGTELMLCQRYYEKSYDLNTAVGTPNTLGAINFMVNAFTMYAGTISYKVPKRTSPTVTPYNHVTGAAGTWYFVASGTTKNVSAVTNTTNTWEPSGAGTWVANDYTYGQWVASAEL